MPTKICQNCSNTGMLPDKVHYLFCGLEFYQFCKCTHGVKNFKKWAMSKKVQNTLKRKRQEQIDRALKFSEIPMKWMEKIFGTIEGQEQVKQIINTYLDSFSKYQQQGRGIYLWGKPGRGKTHFLTALCQEIIKRHLVPSIFITEEHLYRKIRETFDDPKVIESEVFKKFHNIPCLFIDDLGATKPTPWKSEVLTSLLDYRLNNNLPTFFTSNYSLGEYEQISHERLGSRIHEICQNFVIEIIGEDYRRLKRN